MSIAENLVAVRARIDTAARAAGRDASDVTLVAVTKTVPAEIVADAIAAGVHDVGENRAQELVPKAQALAHADARWHFIGRLQRNKVRSVAPYVALWQSVDSAALVEEIAHRAPGAAVLVQVNVAGEAQKGGCSPDHASELVELGRVRGCDVQGLMTVPPAEGDPRPHFERLRALTDDLALPVCSMGMSGDYELAIAAGATMVRVGSAIFGSRPA